MILITGGMGFIGLHTARRFLDAGEDVVITRYRTWREPDFLQDEYGKRVRIESVDTTSHHDMLGAALKHKVTGIVHLSVPALTALTPAEDYRILELRSLEERSVAEVAAELGLTPEAVRKKHSRVKLKLKRRLALYLGEEMRPEQEERQ